MAFVEVGDGKRAGCAFLPASFVLALAERVDGEVPSSGD